MKKFLLAGLILGSFVVQGQAREKGEFCATHPLKPKCLIIVPDPPPPPPPPPPPDGTGGHPPPSGGGPGMHHYDPFGDGFFGNNGPGFYDPFWQRRHRNGFYFEYRTRPNYPVYQSANRCERIASSLRNSGFRKVRAISCNGRTYLYTAYRNGEKLRLSVNSRSGRITRIRPIYY